MGTYILKIKDLYCEWSTVVDAPVTYLMSLEDFKEYYLEEYGRSGFKDLEQRLERVEAKGTSSHLHNNVEDTVAGNQAGSQETELSLDEIYRAYKS